LPDHLQNIPENKKAKLSKTKEKKPPLRKRKAYAGIDKFPCAQV
jgi:hypothetical protein